MTKKEDIQRRYQNAVKNYGANLANDILADPYRFDLDRHVHEFKCRVKSAHERRKQRLARLEEVKISQEHLRVVAQYIRDTAVELGCKKGESRFFSNIVCFGQPSHPIYCPPDDDICAACLAISSLLKEDSK